MAHPRVLLLYNEPTLPADHPDADSEHDILYTADTVGKILQSAGVHVTRFGAGTDPAGVIAAVRAANPDAVFNLYEGTAKWGAAEAFTAGVLELLQVPFTGCPTKPLLMCRSKPLTKQLLAGAGLPTAPFQVIEGAGPVPACTLDWPVIVKPGLEDASVGIDQNSVVTSQEQLEARVRYLRETYGPLVLVERFVRGREFNVAVVERDGVPAPLPFSEILFEPPADAPDLWPIVSFDAKWHPGTRDFVATPAKNPPDPMTPELHAALASLAVRAFELVGCRDYARIDFRVDEADRPFILEVNPNPCISPLAGLAAGLETAKIPYAEFVLNVARAALRRGPRPELAALVVERRQVESLHVGNPGPEGGPTSDVRRDDVRHSTYPVRFARPADVPGIEAILAEAGVFYGGSRERLKRRLAAEVADDTGEVFVADGPDGVAGVAWLRIDDWAKTAALETVCVAAKARRSGVGSALLAAVEREAADAGSKAVLAHVQSATWLGAGRQFLAKHGFAAMGELADFYPDGYARVTYAKPVPPAPTPAQDVPPAESRSEAS